MSHQEDADVVAADLKRRGYTVAVRHGPQDRFFHVQIGPFASKKDVDAMRQRLQADGYNSAIVK
jgi:cell division protein FtsN